MGLPGDDGGAAGGRQIGRLHLGPAVVAAGRGVPDLAKPGLGPGHLPAGGAGRLRGSRVRRRPRRREPRARVVPRRPPRRPLPLGAPPVHALGAGREARLLDVAGPRGAQRGAAVERRPAPLRRLRQLGRRGAAAWPRLGRRLPPLLRGARRGRQGQLPARPGLRLGRDLPPQRPRRAGGRRVPDRWAGARGRPDPRPELEHRPLRLGDARRDLRGARLPRGARVGRRGVEGRVVEGSAGRGPRRCRGRRPCAALEAAAMTWRARRRVCGRPSPLFPGCWLRG
mmetsp:Transcript_110304/g.306743  ORF Transcript_110304/g.306743 Transcript_110304/m.306743 type:complete len:283 (+) Transcript_110304:507-1355(+)